MLVRGLAEPYIPYTGSVRISPFALCLPTRLCMNGVVCSAREVQLMSLSPVLSQLAATPIPIPGLTPSTPFPPPHPHHRSLGSCSASVFESAPSAGSNASASGPYQISSAELVTVANFKPSVHVMSTKTRPKRIGMLGSDGRTYTFLLKVMHLCILSTGTLCNRCKTAISTPCLQVPLQTPCSTA